MTVEYTSERDVAIITLNRPARFNAIEATLSSGLTQALVRAGNEARAALEVVRQRDAAETWLAVPVAPRDTAEQMKSAADRVVVLESPRRFGAVGAWCGDFSQTSDEEVRSLLAEARLA